MIYPVKKPLLFIVLLLATAGSVWAQKITPGDLRSLRSREDSLISLVRVIYLDEAPAARLRADSQFVRTLVRSLQVRNSFQYGYDSLLGISRLYAPDSSFRIFTWAVNYPGSFSRKRGAIQMRTTDGSLRLMPLRDVREFIENPQDSVRSRENWIGAVYYNMVKTTWEGKNYYTLFGIDDYGIASKRKWIEVLSFDERGQPRFGGPFFSFEDGRVRDRFYIEYKKQAATTVNYVDEQNMIVYDHLVSESNQPDLPYTLIPDGDSEGFKWEKGRWVHIDKVFDYKIDVSGPETMMGRPPMGQPILDNNGNINEGKLQEASDRNEGNAKPDPKKKKKG